MDNYDYSKHTISHVDETNSAVNYLVHFGELERHIKSTTLKEVYLECKFGSLRVYFDSNNILKSQKVILTTVNLLCGGIELFIPQNWGLRDLSSKMMGGIDYMENQEELNIKSDNQIIICGKIKMGGIKIFRI